MINELIIAVISGVLLMLISAGVYARKKAKKANQQRETEQDTIQTALRNGVKGMLRNSIIEMYNKYSEKGYMPIYARENLKDLHEEYKALGGNGVLDGLVSQLEKLPTRGG